MIELTHEEESELVYQNYLRSLYEEIEVKQKAECLYHRKVLFSIEYFEIKGKKYDYETYARIPVLKLKHDFYLNKCRNCGEIENPHLNRGQHTPQREYQR